jgi:membrane associated rhomboid family serine protease
MVLPLGDVERTEIVPVGTYGLMVLNVVMFIIQSSLGDQFTTSYAATPYEITHNVDITRPIVLPRPSTSILPFVVEHEEDGDEIISQGPIVIPVWMTLFTAMFMHGSLMHLLGNMFYLWIFGDNVEEVLGTGRYILAYVGCGLAAAAGQIMAASDSLIPTLGASGAIAGLMGMYAVWFPRNRIRVLLPFPLFAIVHIPALWFIGFWIAIQLFLGFGSLEKLGNAGGVAYLAHFGGALAGILIGFLFRPEVRADPPPWWDQRYYGPYPRQGLPGAGRSRPR